MQEIAADLFVVDSSFTASGCRGSTRMTVIRSQNGLVLYSPVSMSDDIITKLKDLGDVRAIIAPNLFHHIFLRAAQAVFPEARVLVPEGLEAKIGPVVGSEIVHADTEISENILHHVFSGHSIRETSLFHRPTGTLVTADLIYNFQAEQFPVEKMFFRLLGIYGRPGIPFYHRLAIEDKKAVSALMDKIRSWPVRRIIPCHGRIIEADDAGEIFANLWARFA